MGKKQPRKKDRPPPLASKQPPEKPLAVRGEFFRGPIPSPAFLREYEIIQDGFAERVIRMGEREQANIHAHARHQHRMEVESLTAQIDWHRRDFEERRVGQLCALVVVNNALFGATCLGLFGPNWASKIAAAIIGGASLGLLANVFIQGRRQISAPPQEPPPPQEPEPSE